MARHAATDAHPFNALPQRIAGHAVAALAALSGLDDAPVTAVHEARLSIKRLRAEARLWRAVDAHAARRMNRLGRKAAGALAPARDADSLAAIAEAAAAQLSGTEARLLRNEADRARAEAGLVDRQAAARNARALLARIETLAGRLKASRTPERAMASALDDLDQRLIQAQTAVRANPSTAALHDLRKRVKDWRYAERALRTAWPSDRAAKPRLAKQLTKCIGDHRDLTRLCGVMEARSDRRARRILAHLTERREELAAQAFALAKRFFEPIDQGDPAQGG